ncbi:RICIN domain-containing protein [Streptomyces iranensis]|uniref:RICIN domain-containing protein n=1 Tax=Streptomyces iranensis TaxID=576784 RepID=UPI0039B77C18
MRSNTTAGITHRRTLRVAAAVLTAAAALTLTACNGSDSGDTKSAGQADTAPAGSSGSSGSSDGAQGSDVFAADASAANNTFIRNLSYNQCIASFNHHAALTAKYCRPGNPLYLWDRRGATIRMANTNICLDSNSAGDVYMMECNGGAYQKWTYPAGNYVRNVKTGKYLTQHGPAIEAWNGKSNAGKWKFFGGN